ncbi:hypothetical protein B0H14DRAFT_3142441 [Mycena olivaceomarginata]|nr:hypothetical protein B0H14DRAFT_3142441 [Mycena olivaceomarginata]
MYGAGAHGLHSNFSGTEVSEWNGATARHLSLNLDLPQRSLACPVRRTAATTGHRRAAARFLHRSLDATKRISTRSLGRFLSGKAPKCAKKGGEKELNLDWELAAGGNRWWARDLARENPEEFKLEWPAYAHLVDDL